MEHPNIARVFDGGATESGRPYFVMELVRGLPITRYCDERRLGTVERLGVGVGPNPRRHGRYAVCSCAISRISQTRA
jgi:hypothetical protein